MSAPLAGWWKCCGGDGKECGREVNSNAFEVCPDCAHEKCNSCGDVERPSPIPEDCETSVYQQNYGGTCHLISYQRQASDNCEWQQRHAQEFQPVQHPRANPSMRGWWHCCQCESNNNPVTTGYCCPVCSHHKCDAFCTVLRQ